ncbi:hypothetical protein AGMMS49975_17300 [Clostridia bacterium]|nr:hypothetical protein AGMMS49975_17300 [Clostridia bacterium]
MSRLKTRDKIIVAAVLVIVCVVVYLNYLIFPMRDAIDVSKKEVEKKQEALRQEQENQRRVPELRKQNAELTAKTIKAEEKYPKLNSVQFYIDRMIRLSLKSGLTPSSINVSQPTYNDLTIAKTNTRPVKQSAVSGARNLYGSAAADSVAKANIPTSATGGSSQPAETEPTEPKAAKEPIQHDPPPTDNPKKYVVADVISELGLKSADPSALYQMRIIPIKIEMLPNAPLSDLQAFIDNIVTFGGEEEEFGGKDFRYAARFTDVSMKAGDTSSFTFYFASVDLLFDQEFNDSSLNYETIPPANATSDIFRP